MQVTLLKDLPEYLRIAIEQGATCKHVCPKCEGGRSKELSLSLRTGEDGVVWFRCWRASCGWRGVSMTDPNAVCQTKPLKPGRPYREPIEPLMESNLGPSLRSSYGLIPHEMLKHGWGHTEDRSLVMPVLCPYGGVRGHTTRTFGTKKFCATYKATAQPWLDHWPNDGDIVVVEDQLSACRLSGLGYHAVALLGTSMSIPQAQELREVARQDTLRRVHLALDRDAFDKSLKMAKRHAHILPMRPICLTQDIKNMTLDRDIQSLFEGSTAP